MLRVEREVAATVLQCEATALGDDPSPDPQVIAVDKRDSVPELIRDPVKASAAAEMRAGRRVQNVPAPAFLSFSPLPYTPHA